MDSAPKVVLLPEKRPLEIDTNPNTNISINNNNESHGEQRRKITRIEDNAKLFADAQWQRVELEVTGYVESKNTGSSEAGYKFILTGGDMGHLTMVTLPMYSLPSACLWIEYDIVICKAPNGSLYRVLKVKQCRYRKIMRDDIRQIIAGRRRRSESGGLQELTEHETIMTNIKKMTKKLPTVIKARRDLAVLTKNSNKDDPDWKIKRMRNLKQEISELLAPCFKGPVFLSLLRFFDVSLLVNLSTEKLRALYSLMILRPHAFCFWDQAMFILSRVKFDGERLFDDLNGDGFSVDPAYVANETLCASLLDETIGTGTYSPYYPLWSISRLMAAVELCKLTLPAPIETIKDAFRIYIAIDRHAYLFGSTRFSVESLKRDNMAKYVNEPAVRFLIDNGIVQWAYGDFGGRTELCKPLTEIWEFSLARLVQERVRFISVIDCRYYNDSYTSEFDAWLKDVTKHRGATVDEMILCSANPITARYMENGTGHKFIGLDDLKSLYAKKAKNKGKPSVDEGARLHIVIDRMHKVSLGQMIALLKKVKKIESGLDGERGERGGAYLYMFGDSEDFRTHARRGGGDVMTNFMLIGNPHVSRDLWDKWNRKDPMLSTYLNLSSTKGINSAKIMFVPLDKARDFSDELKNMDTTTAKKKNKKEYHIFCSSRDDKKKIMDYIYRKRMNMTGSYEDNVFYLGQKVHIMEWDVIGKLEQVWGVAKDGNEYQITGSRTKINIKFGRFMFMVGGIKYDTKANRIEHADVMLISKFAGAPATKGVFIVGTTTTRKQLFCAAKYCLKEIKFFTMDDVNVNEIRDGIGLPIASDLVNKLNLVKFKCDD